MAIKLNAWLIKWRVCDADGTVSLSNVLFMVLVVKLAITPSLDWTTMSAVLLAVMNHNARKWFAKTRADKTMTDQEQLQKITNEVRSLASAVSLKNLSI